MKKTTGLAGLGALVYSTDGGRYCPDCGQPQDQCSCADSQAVLGDGKVRVRRESKGRGGKVVTLVSGLPLTADGLREVAKKLKQACGVGGAVKDAMIEIQGDQQDKVLQWLKSQGYDAKQAGG